MVALLSVLKRRVILSRAFWFRFSRTPWRHDTELVVPFRQSKFFLFHTIHEMPNMSNSLLFSSSHLTYTNIIANSNAQSLPSPSLSHTHARTCDDELLGPFLSGTIDRPIRLLSMSSRYAPVNACMRTLYRRFLTHDHMIPDLSKLGLLGLDFRPQLREKPVGLRLITDNYP
jgi:hypothetical protein